MLMLGARDGPSAATGGALERAALVKSLDMATLWQSCAALVSRVLPCHSCSLLFDIDGYQPLQGRHHLAETHDAGACLVTSLDVAAPYLNANPQIPWYTFSQIASQDAHAAERLRAQNPAPGWREFIHLAFWNDARLEAVLSIRIRAERAELSERELSFLMDLYPLLDASLQRVRPLEHDRVRQQAFEALLHELPLAAILVDEKLEPSYLSREARRICRRWSGDAERSGRLPRAIETPLRRWLEGAAESGGRITLEHPQQPNLRLRVEVGSTAQPSRRHRHHLLVLAPVGEDRSDGEETGLGRALPLLKCLTPSERKVAALVAAGLRNDAIAQKLCRSRKTIESQISSIFRKLDVANRTQLARMLG